MLMKGVQRRKAKNAAIREGLILLFISLMISFVTADMPASFSQAMENMENENTICVKNYDAGVSVTESYKDFEHLDKETRIVSRSYDSSNNESEAISGNASLDASINSNVIGRAHLGWQSVDIIHDSFGRHAFFSGSAEDLTGVFNIGKSIQLWSNSTFGSGGVEWLPCS